ncbi:MAG: ABC transporter ATP-binding protein [Clostridia bacterium]|nr:ABC transporter ATP-binding protein [Clostridia bacterium]
MDKKSELLTDDEALGLENEIIERYLNNHSRPSRLIIKLYLKYKWDFLLSMIFYLIKQLPVILLPLNTATIINAVHAYVLFGTDPFPAIFTSVGVILALLLINIPTNAVYVRLYSVATRKIEAGLRGALIRKLQVLSISFHKQMQSGRIQSKIMRDVENVHTFFVQLITTIPSIALNITVALVVILQKSYVVFLFFLLCIPANLALRRVFRRKMDNSNSEFRHDVENASAMVSDTEEMVQITRAHALEDQQTRKMAGVLRRIASSGLRLDMIQAYFGSFLWVTIQFFQIGCLVFSSYLYVRGTLTEIGDITLFQTYFNTLTWQVSSLIGLMPILAKGKESVSSIGEILCSEDVEHNEGKEPLEAVRGDFKFENVCFSYDDGQELLAGFSLDVRAGETVAIVGESGAGKTTLLSLAIGFMTPSGGRITVDGHDLSEIDLRSYRKHIAYVPQTSVMFVGTVRENLTYGAEWATDEQIEQALRASKMYDFVMSLPKGLDSNLQEHASNLSGGQRQRLSIARALLRNPQIIIFDEATSALDNVSEREIQASINSLCSGRTTFVIAHRLSTIRGADKIAVLKNGHCVELGTYDELIALGGEFYKMQSASEKSVGNTD